MKQRFSIFLAALALTCALTACGSKQNNDQNPTRHDTPSADSSPDTALPGQDDNTVTAPDTTPGQSPAVTDDTGRSDTTTGVPIDEMLKNARVHDRDGDLLDGENHVTSGADHW